MYTRSTFFTFYLLAGCALVGVQAHAGPAGSVRVKKGATLEEAVRALSASVPGVVVADVSAVDARLGEALTAAPVSEALQQISSDYDRCCIRRGNCVVLQRRYSHPDEDAGVETEELRLTAAEMYRLIRPFTPRLRAGRATNAAHDGFAASVTAAQQERMRRGGLAFAELTPDQQAVWRDITAQRAYDEAERELRRTSLLMEAWRETVMEEFRSASGRLTQTIYRFPDPASPQGRDAIQINIARPDRRTPRPLRPEVETRPALERPKGFLGTTWRLPAAEMDLAGLVRRWTEGDAPPLEIPVYARKRRIRIASGGSRRDVLLALADLWGWAISREKDGFRLGRPRLAAARDPFDLHQKLGAAVPPALAHMVAVPGEGGGTDRIGGQMDRVFAAAERVAGPDWKRVDVTRLDEENQNRLANQLVREQLRKGWSRRGRSDAPNPAYVSPERGFLTLSGPLGPGLHPTLMFWVHDANGKREGGWGFAVGTGQTVR